MINLKIDQQFNYSSYKSLFMVSFQHTTPDKNFQ